MQYYGIIWQLKISFIKYEAFLNNIDACHVSG